MMHWFAFFIFCLAAICTENILGKNARGLKWLERQSKFVSSTHDREKTIEKISYVNDSTYFMVLLQNRYYTYIDHCHLCYITHNGCIVDSLHYMLCSVYTLLSHAMLRTTIYYCRVQCIHYICYNFYFSALCWSNGIWNLWAFHWLFFYPCVCERVSLPLFPFCPHSFTSPTRLLPLLLLRSHPRFLFAGWCVMFDFDFFFHISKYTHTLF